jgi:hypothetical protein
LQNTYKYIRNTLELSYLDALGVTSIMSSLFTYDFIIDSSIGMTVGAITSFSNNGIVAPLGNLLGTLKNYKYP